MYLFVYLIYLIACAFCLFLFVKMRKVLMLLLYTVDNFLSIGSICKDVHSIIVIAYLLYCNFFVNG